MIDTETEKPRHQTHERTEVNEDRYSGSWLIGGNEVTTTVEQLVVHRGIAIEFVRVSFTSYTITKPADQYRETEQVETVEGRSYVELRVDGRTVRRPSGTDEQVVAKMQKTIDRWAEDDAMIGDLSGLVYRTADDLLRDGSLGEHVGDEALVWAMGKGRVGRIISETKTGFVVAYTTPSSGGRVYRKRVARQK